MTNDKLRIKNYGVIILLLLFLFGVFVGVSEAQSSNYRLRKGKIYLNLKDANVRSVLSIFAKAMGKSIVAAGDVKGKVTVTYTGITPKKGLEAVLQSLGLDWHEDGGTIFVSAKKILRTYYLNNAKPTDISTIISSILPKGSVVTADDTYNVLVIQTTSDYLQRLEKLVKELDVAPAQVMIEVRMIELAYTEGGTVGTDLSYTNPSDSNDTAQTTGQSGKPTDTDPQGLYAHIVQGNIESYLSAVKNAQNANTIATPRITTLNNREASILIGQKLGYKTSIVSETSTTQQIEYLEVGTSLKITPNITKSGFVRMIVEPKISEGSVTNDLPQEQTTETKNEVMVNDGQTFVIGGLTKDKETETNYGIPFIMDIPLIGSFFRKTVTAIEKRELLVFVTPKILTAEKLQAISKNQIITMEEESSKRKARLIH